MKGLNVRKLAAIATGAALLGTAAAPLVAAIDIKKSDIYNSDGSPAVNIVVGSNAAVSDAIWAGNLAAKIASKAGATQPVAVSINTDNNGSSGTGNLDLSNLTIDVTVGGTVTVSGASSKQFKTTLNSNAGSTPEISTANDTNVLTNAQLPYLVSEPLTEKVNEGTQSNVSTTPTVAEHVGVNADAKFSTSSDTKDLVATIDGGNFYYETVIGSNGVDLGATSFTASNSDNVQVVLFGQTYQLSTASIGTSGTKNLKLVKSSAKVTKFEGDTIDGLVGDGPYQNQAVSVKFKTLVSSGPNATYKGTFELYDSKGNLIDTETVNAGDNLRDLFKQNGNTVLGSNLFVNTIGLAQATQQGYVEVTAGTDTLLLYDGKGYPYDSTSTASSFPYKVSISTGPNSTTDVNKLYKIKIYNNLDQWNTSGFGNLYPTGNPPAGEGSSYSLSGHAGTTAVFGQGLADGILGKGFAKVQFVGFEGKENRTTVDIGASSDITTNLDAQAQAFGGVKVYGVDSQVHYLPFAVKQTSSTPSGSSTLTTRNSGSFVFDTQTTYWDQNFGNAGSTTNDLNFTVISGDYVNNRLWTIVPQSATADANIALTVGGIGKLTQVGPYGGRLGDTNVSLGTNFVIDGVSYQLESVNRDGTGTGGNNSATFSVDGVLTLTKTAAYDPNNTTSTNYIYNTVGTYDTNRGTDNQSYGKLYFTQGRVFDGNASGGSGGTSQVVPGLLGAQSRHYYYAVAPETALNRLWFLMDAGPLGQDESSNIQYNKSVNFLGTNFPTDSSYTEVKGTVWTFANGNGSQDLNGLGRVSTVNNRGIDVNGYSSVNGLPLSNGVTGKSTAAFIPQSTDFNSGAAFSNSNAYFVAEFAVHDAVSNGDVNVYVNTSNGQTLGTFSNNNLTGYASDADFNGTPSWSLTGGSNASYLQGAYADSGTQAVLNGSTDVKISMPQNAENVLLYVYGQDLNKTVSGGSPVTLKAQAGQSVTTDSGTTLTVNAVNGGACSVTGGKPAAAVCSAKPSSAYVPASITNLVYVDTDAPTGHNIIIGGQLVNKLASSLADRLTSESSPVIAEVDASGNIYAAGYTADQTGQAVKELIDAIDQLS